MNPVIKLSDLVQYYKALTNSESKLDTEGSSLRAVPRRNRVGIGKVKVAEEVIYSMIDVL
jgi:hypothetical protein